MFYLKKILLFLLFFSLTLCACGEKLMAETSKEYFNYSIKNGVAIVTGLKDTNINDIRIPEKLDGYYVEEIGASAFQNSKLVKVIIPDSVKTIGESAFEESRALREVSYVKNSGVVTIGDRAFYGCSLLEKVIIGKNVESIGTDAFRNLTFNKAFVVDKNNKYYSEMDGLLYNKNQTVLYQYPSSYDGEFGLPNTLLNIEPYAFAGSKVYSVVLPNSVITIGDSAFKDCVYLTNLQLSNSLEEIGDYFAYNTNLSNLTIPASVTTIGQYSLTMSFLQWVEFLGDVPKMKGKLSGFSCGAILVGDDYYDNYSTNSLFSKYTSYLFKKSDVKDDVIIKDNTLLKYVGSGHQYVIPEGITEISDYAFFAARSLSRVEIPDSVKKIGEKAFLTTSLTEVDLASVEEIGNGAFMLCILLEKAYIPSTVTTIGEKAFYGCSTNQSKAPLSFAASSFDEAFTLEDGSGYKCSIVYNVSREDYRGK